MGYLPSLPLPREQNRGVCSRLVLQTHAPIVDCLGPRPFRQIIFAGDGLCTARIRVVLHNDQEDLCMHPFYDLPLSGSLQVGCS